MKKIALKNVAWLSSSLALFVLCQIGVASANDCKMTVSLSPAGSFVAESSQVEVRGSTSRTGDQVSAKNVAIKLDTLKTGIDLRDEHMKKKYLETQTYPEAVLVSADGSGGNFKGILNLRNQPKPITGTYRFEGPDFIATFKAKISDYGIQKVKYMGVGVNDDVTVEIRLPATPSAPAAAPAPGTPATKPAS
jgi:polyisoprenoid-binding protein YceI